MARTTSLLPSLFVDSTEAPEVCGEDRNTCGDLEEAYSPSLLLQVPFPSA